MKFKLEITRGQQMALIDILISYMHMLKDEPQNFANCSEAPPVVTTTAQLLELIQNAEFIR